MMSGVTTSGQGMVLQALGSEGANIQTCALSVLPEDSVTTTCCLCFLNLQTGGPEYLTLTMLTFYTAPRQHKSRNENINFNQNNNTELFLFKQAMHRF